MQQLLNLTESADNFARVGKGNDLSLKSADGDSGEFSRLMLQQNSGDKELQQLAAKIEAYQKAGNDGEGEVEGKDVERKNVGEPVTRNLWELLQQMKQESAEVSSEGETAVSDEIDLAAGDGELKMTDEQLAEMLEALMAKLDSAGEGEGDAVMTDAERQKFADELLAGMTDSDKQALQAKLQQLIQAAEQGEGAESAVEDAGKFIVNLLEPLLPKADADKLLVGNEKALTQALNEAAERVLSQLSASADKNTGKPQSAEELTNLLKQLEQQVSAQQAKGESSELSLAEQKKLQQFAAELRKILASQNGGADKPQALTQEQSAKAEQLLAEVRQLLKGRTGLNEKSAEGKASESVITATDVKVGKEKAGSGDIGVKSDEGKQTAKGASVNTVVEAETKVADAVQQGQVFRNNTDALADASAARAIQGQMVSTAQGTVAANESGQANTLQALQRPLDLQQTEAS
ncbi:MAG: flagellar hook-length control protein, partial [Idiomarina sp.]|nr:flagellar hook-length control protein [Idiomarina sp.]